MVLRLLRGQYQLNCYFHHILLRVHTVSMMTADSDFDPFVDMVLFKVLHSKILFYFTILHLYPNEGRHYVQSTIKECVPSLKLRNLHLKTIFSGLDLSFPHHVLIFISLTYISMGSYHIIN